MLTVANTFNTNDYYTDNNSVVCTIAYNDYGTTGNETGAEYDRRTQEVKRSLKLFSQVQDFFLNLFYFLNKKNWGYGEVVITSACHAEIPSSILGNPE